MTSIQLTVNIELTADLCRKIVAKAIEAERKVAPTTPVVQRVEELLRNTGKSMSLVDIRLAFQDIYSPKAVSRAVRHLVERKKVVRLTPKRVMIAAK